MKDRLPWFPCYPQQLLAALGAMPPDAGYLYTVMLLRIYEVNGPIRETVATLSRRTGMTLARTQKAMEQLIADGKVLLSEGLYMNAQAEQVLADQMVFQNKRKQTAKHAADARWGKTEANQPSKNAPSTPKAMPGDAHLDSDSQLQKKERKKEGAASPRSSKKGSRIPSEWKLTMELGAFGLSKGLNRNEIIAEAEKFKNYWTAKPGAAGVKLDWTATWRNWIISAAGRLGRVPVDAPPPPPPGEGFDRQTWENLGRIYSNTNNWKLGWGPEPGSPGCKMPLDLQKQFVNPGLTSH